MLRPARAIVQRPVTPRDRLPGRRGRDGPQGSGRTLRDAENRRPQEGAAGSSGRGREPEPEGAARPVRSTLLLPDIEVVGEASDGSEGVAMCRRLAPYVVLMDLLMPRHPSMSGPGG